MGHTPPADDHATFLSSILQVYIVAVEPWNNQANCVFLLGSRFTLVELQCPLCSWLLIAVSAPVTPHPHR
ncbi:hypothetical protein I7I53_01021 [Histoplasma capsulatum var. duboisii H88]|uniref:Uncharacterized protein n=1 Tax=Ajellomyces capsulatus (strain H88) TaxID=544711 RepID=A0A8A1LID2_AJEC8|nr:hypothetical protein I7I53_01021 [Histoplasma capsulatum var. duboisii H88]